jgi:hypothetical protein
VTRTVNLAPANEFTTAHGIYPEHHLWDAVHVYVDVLNAITALSPDHHDQELAPVEEFR